MSTNPDHMYTILLVDDDPGLLDVITAGLELFGNYRVYQARDGLEGLERYFEVRPDCVVLDVKMPAMSGQTLARALRGDPESAATPLVMLTALAQDKDQFSGMASGADRYLIKPVTIAQLVEAVHQAIALSQEQRARRIQELVEESRKPPFEAWKPPFEE